MAMAWSTCAVLLLLMLVHPATAAIQLQDADEQALQEFISSLPDSCTQPNSTFILLPADDLLIDYQDTANKPQIREVGGRVTFLTIYLEYYCFVPMPSSFSRLDALTSLTLSYNFMGPLPPSWSRLTRLKSLEISDNYGSETSCDPSESCTLPSTWSTLVQLEVLSLIGRQLTGPLPSAWSTLSRLASMSLELNNLTGTLPTSWSRLQSLFTLTLSSNQIHGPLPPAWSTMKKLNVLDIRKNRLDGPLPPTWSTMKELNRLDIDANRLNGPLPRAWRALRNLQTLNASSNLLTGTLTSVWSSWTQLVDLDLGFNRLDGPLPDWGRIPALNALNLAGNLLTGNIPLTWTTQRSALPYSLDLSMNRLNGTLHPAFTTYKWEPYPSRRVNISFNDFSGPLLIAVKGWKRSGDEAYGSGLVLDVTGNSFDGPLPELTGVRGFFAANNSFSGSLLTVWPESLIHLDARNNRLGGPMKRMDAFNLVYLNLDNNQLASLPERVIAPNLTYLSIANNSLKGTIPELWETALTWPGFCDLSHNALTGTVPVKFLNQSWAYLALHHNQLGGTLPDIWPGYTAVARLEDNNLTGCLPRSWPLNKTLNVLNVSNNPLSCSSGLPKTWARDGPSSFWSYMYRFDYLLLLAMDGPDVKAVIPKSWLSPGKFVSLKAMPMQRVWRDTAKADFGAKRTMCLDGQVRAWADNGTQYALEKLWNTTASSIFFWLDFPRVFSPPGGDWGLNVLLYRHIMWADMVTRMQDTKHARTGFLDEICGELFSDAVWITALLWGAAGVAVAGMLVLYVVEAKAGLISRLTKRASRGHTPLGDMQVGAGSTAEREASNSDGGINGAPQLGDAGMIRGPLQGSGETGSAYEGSFGACFFGCVCVFLYWLDVASDVVAVVILWRSWPASLLLVFVVVHFALSNVVLLTRLNTLGGDDMCGAALVLLPLLPFIDAVSGWALMLPRSGLVRALGRHLGLSLAVEWRDLFNMRNVLEVLFESIPASAVLSVAFVLGSKVGARWYLPTWLYLLSSVTSACHILVVLAHVLVLAVERDVAPWAALRHTLTQPKSLLASGSADGSAGGVANRAGRAQQPTAFADFAAEQLSTELPAVAVIKPIMMRRGPAGGAGPQDNTPTEEV